VSGLGLIVAIGLGLVTILFGHLAKWILENFLAGREAAIAAFSFLLGEAVFARALGIYHLEPEAVAEGIGSLLGLVVLWWSFFKRKVAHG
jgi:hypothetical protein